MTDRACNNPPIGGVSYSGFHVFFKRLIYGFNTYYKWAILQVVLIGVILTSTIFYVPSATILNSVSDNSEDSVILGLYRTGLFDHKLDFQGYYLANLDTLTDEVYRFHYWEKLFSVGDVAFFSSISGVERVLAFISMDCGMKNYNPNEFSVERFEEYKKSYLENETRKANIQPYSDLLGITVEDWIDYLHSYSYSVYIIAVDLEQVQDWDLWFTNVQEGEYPESPDSGLFSKHFKSEINNATAEIRVGTHGRYKNSDEYKYYIFYNEQSIPITGYINANTPTIITGLEPFLEFLENTRQENSVTLPSYTDIYLKVSHPLDRDRVIREIEQVYPDVEIQSVGTAPSTHAQQYREQAQLSGRISYVTFILLGGILVLGKLYENHLSRKQIWLFKSRGWGWLELLSYSLTRNAIIGVLGSMLATIIVILGKDILVSSLFTPTLAQISPTISNSLEPALYQLLSYNSLLKLAFMGVMLAVATDVLALTYSIYSHPPNVAGEK